MSESEWREGGRGRRRKADIQSGARGKGEGSEGQRWSNGQRRGTGPPTPSPASEGVGSRWKVRLKAIGVRGLSRQLKGWRGDEQASIHVLCVCMLPLCVL